MRELRRRCRAILPCRRFAVIIAIAAAFLHVSSPLRREFSFYYCCRHARMRRAALAAAAAIAAAIDACDYASRFCATLIGFAAPDIICRRAARVRCARSARRRRLMPLRSRFRCFRRPRRAMPPAAAARRAHAAGDAISPPAPLRCRHRHFTPRDAIFTTISPAAPLPATPPCHYAMRPRCCRAPRSDADCCAMTPTPPLRHYFRCFSPR